MAIGSRIRAEALVLLPDFISQGLGPSAISRLLGAQGLSYRKTDFLADVRRISGRSKYEAATRSVAADDFVPRRIMVETEFTRPRNYRYHYEVQLQNQITGEVETVHRSMYGNRMEQVGELEDEYIDYSSESESDPDFAIIGATLVNVEHFEGRPY